MNDPCIHVWNKYISGNFDVWGSEKDSNTGVNMWCLNIIYFEDRAIFGGEKDDTESKPVLWGNRHLLLTMKSTGKIPIRFPEYLRKFFFIIQDPTRTLSAHLNHSATRIASKPCTFAWIFTNSFIVKLQITQKFHKDNFFFLLTQGKYIQHKETVNMHIYTASLWNGIRKAYGKFNCSQFWNYEKHFS